MLSFLLGRFLVAEVLGCMINLPLTFKELIIFHSGCTTLHFHQQYIRISASLHSYQYLSLFIFFLIIDILIGTKCYCSFDFSFPMNEWSSMSFMCLLDILYCLWRNIYSNLCSNMVQYLTITMKDIFKVSDSTLLHSFCQRKKLMRTIILGMWKTFFFFLT